MLDIDSILQNNTFDLPAMERAIDDIRNTSYTKLYEYQKQLTGIRRFDLRMSDLVLKTNLDNRTRFFPRKFVGTIDGDFIHPKKRLAYKRSAFYNKEVAIADVAKNPSLFAYSYLVFVDGKFIDSVNIFPKEDKTLVIVDVKDELNAVGMPKDYYERMVAKNARITVFFIPNASYGTLSTNINVLKLNKDKLALTQFDIANNMATDTQYVTFINSNNLLFSSVITDTTNSADMLRFSTQNAGATADNRVVHLNIFGFRHLTDILSVAGDEKFFKLNVRTMPVVPENMMIYRVGADGRKTFAHDITIKMYYPNIYEVIGNTNNDALSIYVFYSNPTTVDDVKYVNELALFQAQVPTYLDQYKNGTIPAFIRDFDPGTFNYSINDFKLNSTTEEPLEYKISKFREWVAQHPSILDAYMRYQVQTTKGYYVDVSKLDLSTKLRTDNMNEIKTPSEQVTFTGERYLFILRNEFGTGFQHLRFFIDGLAYAPDVKFKDSSYEYYYIQKNLIKADSIIEIERFTPFEFHKDVTLKALIDVNTVISGGRICRNDIFVIDKATRKYIDANRYTIAYFDKDGEKVILPPLSFKLIPDGKFMISTSDTGLLNQNLEVWIHRGTNYNEFVTGADAELGESFSINYFVNPDKRKFRIFRNGQLLPDELYKIYLNNGLGGSTRIEPLIIKRPNDRFIVDYTPNSYVTTHRQDTIPTNGIVDLRGKITKPFDLKWFDVYLNGRRLSKKNIRAISPFLIIIENVKSLKNLVIMEHDRDTDVFTLAPDYKSVTDKLWETDEAFKNSVLSTVLPNENTEPDVITEIISVQVLELKMFLENYMPTDFINPSVNQIDSVAKDELPSQFIGDVKLLNPNAEELGTNPIVLMVTRNV